MPSETSKHIREIRQFILQNAVNTLKDANDYLRYPFIDPGSVYDGNLWDWDSFWAAYALLPLAQDVAANTATSLRLEQVLQHAAGNVLNFFDQQLADGYIPMMIEKTDLPEPYLNLKHKSGFITNMHKPFLCQQACLVSDYRSNYTWLGPFLPKIKTYFECYDSHYFNQHCGLYVWADDVMIGMDNDPASFGRPRFTTANIFLNAFMVKELQAAGRIYRELGQATVAEMFAAKAAALITCIQNECWDPRDQFFYSVDVDIKTRSYDWFHQGLGVFWKTLPLKIRTWSGFLPLWAGFASATQAESLVNLHFGDKNTFNSPYGIMSLARDEKMFNLTATSNPSNWLGPIWLVVNYLVFKGLLNYGYQREAEQLCVKTVSLLGTDLEQTGTFHEYYHPFTGAPIMNGGFLNWNMLVLNMLRELGVTD